MSTVNALQAAVTAAIQGWRGLDENKASAESADKAACVLHVAVREFEAGNWYSAATLAEVATDIVEADQYRTLSQWSAFDDCRYLLGDLIDAARAAAEVTA